jgi:alcohol dehydrogenase class IV
MTDHWYFKAPYICFGQGALTFLDSIASTKCLIVTDPGIIKFKVIDPLIAKLAELKKKYEIFSEVEPDPSESIVMKGLEQCRRYQPDLIIGLGGGSSLDTAKTIWALYERPDLTMDEVHPFMILNIGVKTKCLAIPTTSGTGAEVTWATVITRKRDDGTEIKLELANKELIPTYAILDPIFTKSMPHRTTVSTAFDAYSHLVESFVCIWRSDFSDAMGVKAARMIREYLPIIIKDNANSLAREKLHNAACLAGLAFGNAQVTLGHALGHAIGATFHLVHGETVGVFMAAVLQFSINDPIHEGSKKALAILADVAKQMGLAQWSDDSKVAAMKFIADIKEFQKLTGFPTTLKDMGLTQEKLKEKMEELVKKAMESNGTALNLRPVNDAFMEKIFWAAFEGKDVDF